MVSFTYSALSLLAFGAIIIEPVIGAKVVEGLGAGITGGLSGGGQKRDFADFVNRDFVNRRDASSDAKFQSLFAECVSLSHQQPPTLTVNSDKTITMNGLAPICITEINTYNAQPNIAALEETQGKIQVVNSTAIHISGVSSTITEYIEKLAKTN
jgi:hypothetical protein